MNNTEKKLYDLLSTKNFDNFEVLDSKTSRPPIDPKTGQEDVSFANMYKFDWTSRSGKNYGTAIVLLSGDNNLEVYFGDNLGRSMEAEDKTEWYDFLHQLKNFSTKNFKTFSPKNLNQLRYTMQGQAAIKEGLFESWTGTRTQSWNGTATEARLMIKHKRALGENDARFRYVESLFIETAEGERYRLPFTKLAGGRAMLEHVRNGGRPYDLRGQHIVSMVEELNVLSRFQRAHRGQLFEGDTADLIEQVGNYHQVLKKNLKTLETHKGYQSYFESWSPADITESELVVEGLKQLFVTQSIDQRIEAALPLLARIQQQGNAMKEANIFEAWANRLMEGTWALPDTAEQQAQLVALMSQELPVGPDATNATEQLYELFGDDKLFDQLETLSTSDPDADARPLILSRMEALSEFPEVAETLKQINNTSDTDVEVDAEVEKVQEIKDPATQTEDPADTKQPDDAGYDDTLSTILKRAGVTAQDKPAPDYEASVEEGIAGGFAGGAAGATAGAALGGLPGAVIGGLLGAGAGDSLTDEEVDMEEGWKGQLAGGTAGTLAGAALGAPLGPIGSAIGGALGGTAGQMAGDALGGTEETDEGKLGAVAGGALGGAATRSVKGAVAGAKLGSAIQDRYSKKEDTSALAGQYGHSGKMKPVAEDADFLDRLKELSGMIRN